MEPFSDYVTYSSAPSSRPMAENESRNMLVRDQKLGSQARMEDPLQGEFPREVLDQDTTTRAAFCMSLLTQKHLQDFLTSHLSAITDFESKVRRRLSRFQVSINVVQNRLAMYKASQKFSSTRAVASKNAHAEASRPQQTLPYSEYEKLEFVNRELTRKLGSSLKYKIECEELRQAIDGCWTKIAELEGENRHLRAENSRLSSEMLRPIQWAPDQQLVAANHAEVYQANHENSVRQSADEIFQLRAEMAEGRRELYKVTAMLEMFKEENMALQEKLENAESKVKVLVERGINM
ncbi:hypothetical protein GUITHDRAFT_113613 [Guillardia theta CCMP2712]|uniref:Uncharacterized protein n=1 Tax=Guillardia theta (strain CCMP2712) TaxID=905079 RepID=L1IX01_GUITC|nr:hypothetical protein GUITHDRAFT_113613 [Guillardia theta CCMP2712]EKX40375.1 hypothetical protein GUITHDRAFT_113613 [Guillardia theta CCMP2712]|eukprot:XP_005827355.1 hypothetical protein GUITHDRAFT_113613 [Guillardia theta CCMP2712]